MPIAIKLLKQYLQKKFGEDPELTILKRQLANLEKLKTPKNTQITFKL
jgi:hypothetical protein